MKHIHNFSFGQLELQDSYAIIICNDAVKIDYNEVSEIETVLQRRYYGKRFGLIANRKNQYSVNPLAIDKLFSDKNLIAGAIVGYTDAARYNAEIENNIVQGAPIEFFTSKSSAIKWIEDKI